jgi:2-keto-3-deoxy-L-rhamnonate aldolase RhmA
MRINETKRKLQAGEVAVGCWFGLGSPRAARRLAADAGFDWLMIDLEHSPIDREGMAACILAIADGSEGKVAPLVRVPDLSPGHVKQALDAGAYGVLAPMITTVDEVTAFVQGCRYAPQGVRGVYGSGASTQAFKAPFAEYYDAANAQILIAVQIETRPALDAADAIAAVDGVDVLFVGPNDLQAALGLKPRYDSTEPELLAAYERVLAACRRHGKAAGILTASPEGARQRRADGFTFVGMGNDLAYMIAGAKSALAASQ